MQADIVLLPRRASGEITRFNNADKFQFFTNHYQVLFDQKNSTIYQYYMESDIPADSTEMLFKVVKSIQKDLKDKIGLVSFRGSMLWGVKPSNLALAMIAKVQKEGEPDMKVQVLIKQTKELQIKDLLKEPDNAAIMQVLNSNTKEKLRKLRMCQLGPGKFFNKEDFLKDSVNQNGIKYDRLSIWRGFKFSMLNINKSLSLQIDVCSRILRTINFLETMNGGTKDFIRDTYTGATILTRYGNHRTFRIEEFNYQMSPLSKFKNEKKGQLITFQAYYKEAYNMKISNPKQPLLKVVSRIEKQIKNGKIEETKQYIYLIPEFVSLTGMADEHRGNKDLMRDVANFTKMTPDARVHETERIKQDLNKVQGMYNIGEAKRLNGYILNQPELLLSGKTSKRPRQGVINLRDQIRDAADFKDWVFVYSQSSKGDDDREADYCVETLIKASETFGINIKQPGFITVKGRNHQAWIDQIRKDIKENGKPQIVVFFLTKFQEKYYPALKQFLTNEVKVASQGIRRYTIGPKSKSALSCASKVVLQMNAKVGKALWEVKSKHPYFQQKKVMYGAISISKSKRNYTLGFVGTTNPGSTTFYSDCKTGIQRKEDLPEALLQQFFIQWAKNYVQANKSPPDIIILYREGLSESQMQRQLEPEVAALNNMVQKIAEKIKKPNYSPEILYIVANKKINTRFFAPVDKNQNMGKFIPKLGNPPSGSIIVQELSANYAQDFHLVPQFVNQGTCTPTHYRIAYNSTNMPMEAIAEFTFEQCFNYYNWQGAVRVPACMQAADKLSKLVGESIREDIDAPELQKVQHFL